MRDQFDKGEIALEADISGKVEDVIVSDGEKLAITYFELSNVDAGTDKAGEGVRLLLPGGHLGDLWVEAAETPRVGVGDHVVLVGTIDSGGVLRLASFGNSVFHRATDVSGSSVVTDPRGDPFIAFPCDGRPTRAGETNAVSEDGSSKPTQVSAPPLVGWDDFVATIRACQAERRNP